MLAVRRRRIWVAVLAVLAGLGASATIAGAAGPALRPVQLPRDHGAHPAFEVEWWYTTGTVTTAAGRPYFWFATVWTGDGYRVARVNVVDLKADRIVLAREYLAKGLPAAGSADVSVGKMRLARHLGGARAPWSIDARVPGSGQLRLSLTPTQPYLLEGPRGILAEAGGTSTAYLSAPRLSARGTLTLRGRTARVRGLGWFDHQWGNFGTTPAALHWNWFGCQLGGGADLMLSQSITPTGTPTGTDHVTYVSPRGAVRYSRRVRITPLGRFVHPTGAKGRYPLRWRLVVPAAHLDLTIVSRVKHGFIGNQLVPGFWEAPAAVTRGGSGACTVESTRES
jgi:predicted secreted hydrolase